MPCSRLFKQKYTIRQWIEKNDEVGQTIKFKKLGWYLVEGP
jgi:hypothetical protein